jgi:hypothetical protein
VKSATQSKTSVEDESYKIQHDYITRSKGVMTVKVSNATLIEGENLGLVLFEESKG